jgi:hypothetical protein
MTFRTVGIVSGFLLMLAAAGCSGQNDDGDEVAAALGDWIGEGDRELVLKWGAPDAVYDMKNGSRILTWRRSRTESQGGELYTVTETQVVDGKKVVIPITHQTPVITWRYECVTSFEVDRYGNVAGYTAEGNDCIGQPQPD